jgi:hypothetical protein
VVHHDLLVSFASAAKFSSSVAWQFGRRPRFFTPRLPRGTCPGRREASWHCVATIAGAFWPADLLSSALRRASSRVQDIRSGYEISWLQFLE